MAMHSSAYLVGAGWGGCKLGAARSRRDGGAMAPWGARRVQLPAPRGPGRRCGFRRGCMRVRMPCACVAAEAAPCAEAAAEARMGAARAHGATSCG